LSLGDVTQAPETRNRQRCIFPPLGAHTPASRIVRANSFGTGSGFSRRIDRVVRIISNRSAVFAAAFDIVHAPVLRAVIVASKPSRGGRATMPAERVSEGGRDGNQRWLPLWRG